MYTFQSTIYTYNFAFVISGLIQNATIEERVTLLEIHVVEIEEDVTDLDQDVNFLFEETIMTGSTIWNKQQSEF